MYQRQLADDVSQEEAKDSKEHLRRPYSARRSTLALAVVLLQGPHPLGLDLPGPLPIYPAFDDPKQLAGMGPRSDNFALHKVNSALFQFSVLVDVVRHSSNMIPSAAIILLYG